MEEALDDLTMAYVGPVHERGLRLTQALLVHGIDPAQCAERIAARRARGEP